MNKHPFKVRIEQETLDDLRARLQRTRWPDEVEGAGWNYGTNLAYLKTLVSYWQHEFDWRTQEQAINHFAHFKADVDGIGIHFIHERGKGTNALPLLLLHGWPSSFVQMLKIIPLLTDPQAYGGNPTDSFDVIVASLPGYGFSDRAREQGMNAQRMADAFANLMSDELGYSRYALRGTDLGRGVIMQLAQKHQEAVVGIHTGGTMIGGGYYALSDDLTSAEQAYVRNLERWRQQEMGYAMLHSTKPQTLAYGLNDSPAGLAAWIIEKFRSWSDCDGDVEKAFTRDELLTNLTIYWATETINSSMRLYYESSPLPMGEMGVPIGWLQTAKDMFPMPRSWVERFYKIDRWTDLPAGGHFPEWEQPDAVARDIRTFFRSLR